jgi:hypothetical protein
LIGNREEWNNLVEKAKHTPRCSAAEEKEEEEIYIYIYTHTHTHLRTLPLCLSFSKYITLNKSNKAYLQNEVVFIQEMEEYVFQMLNINAHNNLQQMHFQYIYCISTST